MPEKAPPPWRADAAVGVDDDLAAGQAGVAHRAAGDEAAGRVDQHEAGILEPLVRAQRPLDDRAQHVLDDVVADPRLIVDVRMVLSRDQQPLDAQRHEPAAVLAVAHGHLGLAVRPQVVDHLGLAHRRQPLGDPMREVDRQRHQRLGVSSQTRSRTSCPGRRLPGRRRRTPTPRAAPRRRSRRRGGCPATARRAPPPRRRWRRRSPDPSSCSRCRRPPRGRSAGCRRRHPW